MSLSSSEGCASYSGSESAMMADYHPRVLRSLCRRDDSKAETATLPSRKALHARERHSEGRVPPVKSTCPRRGKSAHSRDSRAGPLAPLACSGAWTLRRTTSKRAFQQEPSGGSRQTDSNPAVSYSGHCAHLASTIIGLCPFYITGSCASSSSTGVRNVAVKGIHRRRLSIPAPPYWKTPPTMANDEYDVRYAVALRPTIDALADNRSSSSRWCS